MVQPNHKGNYTGRLLECGVRNTKRGVRRLGQSGFSANVSCGKRGLLRLRFLDSFDPFPTFWRIYQR